MFDVEAREGLLFAYIVKASTRPTVSADKANVRKPIVLDSRRPRTIFVPVFADSSDRSSDCTAAARAPGGHAGFSINDSDCRAGWHGGFLMLRHGGRSPHSTILMNSLC